MCVVNLKNKDQQQQGKQQPPPKQQQEQQLQDLEQQQIRIRSANFLAGVEP